MSAIGVGIEDALFMNGQNWQTIPRIVLPLRRLGVPATAVMDLDVLMDKDFKHIWPLVDAPSDVLGRLQKARAAVKAYMDKATRPSIKALGLNALTGSERASAEGLIKAFAQHGVFFVPNGELEGWMQASGAKRSDKAKWLLEVFAYMGADPDLPGYLKPSDDDVWSFVSELKTWIDNPLRLGIPD